MLKFVRSVRHHMSRSDVIGPVVVHCSAGVGRTGTFIGVDMLTQKMEDAREKGILGEVKLSVQEVVCKMRAQRGNMVQTSVSTGAEMVGGPFKNKNKIQEFYVAILLILI